jgi:hypothetical protein
VSGCGQSNRDKKNNHTDLIKNNFLGVWKSVERIYPYRATLVIDSSYKFAFVGGACVLHFESQGKWKLNGDTLILDSFYPEKCCYIREFGVNCTVITIIDSISETNDSTSFELKTSIKDCIPDYIDEYILFENEKFLIEDSVLTHIQKSKALCPEIKDNFTKQDNAGKYDNMH